MEETKKSCILLNKIFEGSYTDNFTNIPHEIIDFFKADNNKYYVYNNPFGDFSSKHEDYKPEFLILTSATLSKENKVKILYLIKLKEALHPYGYDRRYVSDSKFRNSQNYINQQEIIKNNISDKIKYGDYSLDQIYGKKDKTYMVTFEAEWIKEPTDEIIYEFSKSKGDYNFQRNTGIVHSDDPHNAYKELLGIINNNKWKEISLEKIEKKDIEDFKKKQNPIKQKTFLDFTLKVESETCYTNFIYNIFAENPKLVNKFIRKYYPKNKLGKNFDTEEFYIIYQEHPVFEKTGKTRKFAGRMDISGESGTYRFCIENKIYSDIVVDKDGRTQLGRYFDNWTNGTEIINGEEQKYTPISFILVPDEEKEKIQTQINQLDENEKKLINKNYKIITYNKMYDFFTDEEIKKIMKKKKNSFSAKFYDDIVELFKRMGETKHERTKRLFLAKIAECSR